jgi:hypothetical protein
MAMVAWSVMSLQSLFWYLPLRRASFMNS